MPIDAVASIGLADTGAIPPVSPVRAMAGRATLLVRAVSAGASAGGVSRTHDSTPRIAPPERACAQRPMRGTAYQRNADGDSATFSSRLGDLTGEERAELAQLRKRDQEVRTHESAHIAAGGGLVRGGPTFDFQTGPDGRDYAAGGHVRIDSSPGSTPEETIAKARRIRQAALAPAEPSSQDLAVAAKASGMEAAARAALSRTSRQGRLRQLDARPTADRTTPDRAPSPAHADGVRLDVFG